MDLGLVTIQRNRGPWLVEWFAFHYLVGFRKFYFYAHRCDDNTAEIVLKLQKRLDITALALPDQGERIQLQAYQHACENYIHEVDWMCFLDGDEFMLPTAASTIQEALWPFNVPEVSAIGVYNVNFGSSGHIAEPQGLITENYRRRAPDLFLPHRRVKSIVKGRQTVHISNCSNIFVMPQGHGTIDELGRPVTWGYMPQYEPSYKQLRFNHYVSQSRDYFEQFKRNSGHADASPDALRGEDWWKNFNTNDEPDDSMVRFAQRLRATMAELTRAMEA